MSLAKRQDAITTAVQLWDAVIQRAGLRISPRRGGRANYDTQLVEALRAELQLPAGPIRNQLAISRCTLEALLSAIMVALQPWSQMMRDVLAMLAEAQASSGGDALELRMTLDKIAPEMRESINGLKQQIDVTESILGLVSNRRWGELKLWSLRAPRDTARREFPNSPLVQTWFDRCMSTEERPPPPPFERTGYRAFDRAMVELQEALRSCLRACRAAGNTVGTRSTKFANEPDRDFGDGWRGSTLGGLDSDFAVGAVLRSYDELLKHANWGAEAAAEAAEHIQSQLAIAPLAPDAPMRMGQLLDLFALPVWKRRHELYSVWIATLVKRAAEASGRPMELTRFCGHP